MKKRHFIKTLTGASLSLMLGNAFSSCSVKEKQTAENQSLKKGLPDNWIWMRPDTSLSDDQWKSQFEKIRKAGFEAILPQVYSSRDTLFDHPVLPVKERWLERIIPIAHAAGLQVHAWMWTMILNEPGMVEKHPDWFSFNRLGQPAHTHPAYVDYYKFMCPCHPEVAEFVGGNVEALGKIEDLDGIHLDYVRQPDVILAEALQPKYNIVQDQEYPEYDYPYSENCRNLFKAKFGTDPMDLADPVTDPDWRQFRYDAVSNIVNNHCVPMAKKYGKTITAAVFPNWESVRQQWHRWNLDAFLPMLYHGFYNADINWVGEEVQKALQRLDNSKPVYAGLFKGHIEPEQWSTAIEVSKKAGGKGISVFDLGSLKEEDWAALGVALQR